MTRDVWAELGDVPIRFWVCPVHTEASLPGAPRRETVRWIDGVAHCMVDPDCARTSDDEETAGALLARLGTDATIWAQEFVLHALIYAESGDDPLDPAPGDFLHGWFANAIETGRDAGYWAGVRDAESGRQQSVEKFLETATDD